MTEIIHNLGKKTTVIEVEGCHHEDLVAWIEADEEINNFIGFLKLPTVDLDSEVPDVLGDNTKQATEGQNQPISQEFIDEMGNLSTRMVDNFVDVLLFNDDGTKLMVKKTFREYFCIVWESIEAGHSIARVCHRGVHSSNTGLTSDQLKNWITYFGIDNIYTMSCFRDIIKQAESGVII